MMYKVILTKKALRHVNNLKAAGFYLKAQKIRNTLRENPYPSISKELSRELKGKQSIRINIQHRIVYEVLEDQKIVKILSMWGHYSD